MNTHVQVKEFTLRTALKNSLERRGRLHDYIVSQLIIHGMQSQAPYTLVDDQDSHMTIIRQEQRNNE